MLERYQGASEAASFVVAVVLKTFGLERRSVNVLDHTNETGISDDMAERVAALARRAMGQQTIRKAISRDGDLHAAGLSSLGLVNLMLSVEEEFDITVPERDMTPANFRTIAGIVELVHELSSR
jgi:acyl carrier protein